MSPEQRRTLALLRAGVILGVALPLVLFCIVAGLRYREEWAASAASTRRTARIVSEHALKMFDTNEVLLRRVDDLLDGQSDAQITANEAQLHNKIVQMVGAMPQIQSVGVLDASGHVLLTNRYLPAPRKLDLSERPSFIAHRAGQRGVYVSSTIVGKLTHDVFFDLTRRRNRPDGSFAGTVQVSLYRRYLVDFYKEVAASELDTTVTLVRSDGAVIARWPDTAPGARLQSASLLLDRMRRGETSGSLLLTSTIDGVERLLSFRKVGDYPVYVGAAIRRDAIVAGWARSMVWLALFTIPGAAALGAAGLLALRKTRRELNLANSLYLESVQRKQVEHALLHAQKMEALGHLTGGVAHDFNNVLMVIGMNAQLLRLAPGLRDNPRLESIQRSVEGGAKLTRQLLSFSRRQPLLPATIDLHAELPGIVELCKPVLGKAVALQVTVAPSTPLLTIDRAELELSLINLAINARHAMADGGRFEVLARAACDAQGEPQVEIVARDTGCGIDPAILARVTEPFFSTRPVGEGTGLGLSQVNSMCQRAGGSLRIESAPGMGTAVHLRFPAAAQAVPAPRDEAGGTGSFPIRLLLVEDNSEIASATMLALESFGCTVRRCSNADEAVAYIAQADVLPDAVLSDITMPGTLDGIGLARHLRKHHPDMRVALMTGYADRLADAEELQLRVLPKPFDVQALRQVLAWLTAAEPQAA